ncbi:SMP-30/gluconolactonase/LRE family protein [Alteromonas aestuariivivens]|uniref:SMP-30/gluconolactonase/LRE family protein n=1 Tax=Alteromonas aestuariivivens TaxID=1938339 RepID=A0A3D8MGK4_9ALTE|nr:SMP-30/gluconolactonase/LRE family protein [Alteromonas aestuariivivens]RDV29348.1 SMP-30/gluconolactonase/LRE family protein [Alteromonas aestuariivivens]
MSQFTHWEVPIRALGNACLLGENPYYHRSHQRLYWVDIFGNKLHWMDLASQRIETLATAERLCWVVETESEQLLAGFQSRLCLLDTHSSESKPWCRLADEPGHNRLNDATVDHYGNLWFGSMDDNEEKPTGSLYFLGRGKSPEIKDTGYTVTNGPAHCARTNRLFHASSTERLIYVFDITEQGDITGKRVFARFSETMGYPDGLTVDDQGGLWVAQWGGGGIVRFQPDGTPDLRIALPAPYVTNTSFVASSPGRLYVTTSTLKMSSSEKQAFPDAGKLFELDISQTGLGGVYPPHFRLT